MHRLFLMLILSFVFYSCFGWRTVYPKVSGYVYDQETGTPISDCSVNNIATTVQGYFEIKEKRSRVDWRTKYWMDVELIIRKEGFVSDTIIRKAGYGGYPKGMSINLDTLFLERL